MVSLVKRAIKKILGRACLSDEELQTLITKIEGTLNSRPLLSMGTDFKDGAVLTPAHFISPGSQLGMPPWDEDPNDPDWTPNPRAEKDLLQSYTKNQRKLDDFWKIFSSQYIQELRDSHHLKFKSQPGEVKRKPVVGEVCLLQEHGPRLHWPLVRIEELLTSSDGETRYVKIKLPSRVITRRGVKDLVPLEINLESEPEKSVQQLVSFTRNKPSPIFQSARRSSQIENHFPGKCLMGITSISLMCFLLITFIMFPAAVASLQIPTV